MKARFKRAGTLFAIRDLRFAMRKMTAMDRNDIRGKSGAGSKEQELEEYNVSEYH